MQYNEVKELIAIFEKTDLYDMEIQLDNARIRLSRGQTAPVSPWGMPPVPAQPASVLPPVSTPIVQTTVNQNAKADDLTETVAVQTQNAAPSVMEGTGTKVIKAPIVGTFYQSSSPEEEPFVKVGDTVAEGDVVCIIEAMKFMNEVNSEVSGTITEILVGDGEFVEYGQELFRVK